MTDLTAYTDQELSLLVFNTEDLYNMRKRRDFVPRLRLIYTFTDAQLAVLEQDLREDEAEQDLGDWMKRMKPWK